METFLSLLAAAGMRFDAPDPVEVGVEPAAGHALDELEHPLPLPQRVEQRGRGAQLERVGGHEHQVGGDPRNISVRISLIHWARSGGSTPMSALTASMKGTSLANPETQSMRLTSVVIWA